MSKVITFSRKFPAYHTKAGQPTFFVEQVLNSLGIDTIGREYILNLQRWNIKALEAKKITPYDLIEFQHSLNNLVSGEKKHTIRSGDRWKNGQKASLRVWSGKPYRSTQIIFAPEVDLNQTGKFVIKKYQTYTYINIGKIFCYPIPFIHEQSIISSVAINDGLNKNDFLEWFKYPTPFNGQILCWKEVFYG